MGCGASSDNFADPVSEKRNNDIDRQLAVDRKRLAREVKILLLGAGESGKSTVLKQMRLLKEGSPSTDECLQYREVIYGQSAAGGRRGGGGRGHGLTVGFFCFVLQPTRCSRWW